MFIYLRICLSFLNFSNMCIIMESVAFTTSAGFCHYFFGCIGFSVQCQTCFSTDSMVGLE